MDHNPKLRLHIEEDLAREQRWQQRLHACLPEAKGLAEQFEATTGWLLNYQAAGSGVGMTTDERQMPIFGRFEIADLSEKWPPGKPAVSRVECERLLAQVNRLVGKIESLELERQSTRNSLEVATEDSPLLPTNSADRVANLLRFAKSELAAIGAAVYLLDDATTHLRLRSMIAPTAVAPDVESVRPLENALADLESLIGNHVNIQTPEMGETWRIPQPFKYGWCCLLGTKNLPLGTVWIFFSQPRSLDDAKSEFLSNLSNQIFSEIHSRENPESADADSSLLRQELLLAARSNDARLPSFAPEIDGWKLAGWTYRHGYLASTFHDWAVTPAGNLSVSVGQVVGPMLTAAMSLNNLRSLISAHRDYRHTGLSLTAKLNEQVWCNSPGDEMASLIYALVDPETDRVQVVNAGDGGVVLGGPFGIQSIDQFQTPLGVDLETPYVQWERVLQETETLVMFTQGLRHAISESVASASDADLLRAILLRNPGQPQAILAEIEERFFRSDFQHVAGDLSVLVLSRNSAPPTVHQLAAEMSQSILAELRADHENTLEALAKRLEHGDDWDDSAGYSPIIEVGRQDFDPDWSSDDDSDLAVLEPDTAELPLDQPAVPSTVGKTAAESVAAIAADQPAAEKKRTSAKRLGHKQEPTLPKQTKKPKNRASTKPRAPSKSQSSSKSPVKTSVTRPETASVKQAAKPSAKSPAKRPTVSNSQTQAQSARSTKADPTAANNPKTMKQTKSSAKAPVKSPAKSSIKSSAKASVKSPAKSSIKSSAKASAKSPAKSPAKVAVKSPAKTSSNTRSQPRPQAASVTRVKGAGQRPVVPTERMAGKKSPDPPTRGTAKSTARVTGRPKSKRTVVPRVKSMIKMADPTTGGATSSARSTRGKKGR